MSCEAWRKSVVVNHGETAKLNKGQELIFEGEEEKQQFLVTAMKNV